VENAGGSETSCRKCAVCAVNCTMGFRVNERLAEITRLASLPSAILG